MTKEAIAEVEIAEPVAVIPRAVMAGAAQLKRQMTRDQDLRKVINEYIDNNMESGKDYGSITIKGAVSKPSLLKPGAEKFCSLFKVRPTFRKDEDTCNMLGDTPGIVAYVCELVDTKGLIIGEGRGAYKVELTDSDFNINKAIKIAEKRAQVDAVLRTGCLSDFFTQDVEDAPQGVLDNQAKAPMTGAPSAAQLGLIDKLVREKGLDQEPPPETKQEASDTIAELMKL
jgi:hypothetical protein